MPDFEMPYFADGKGDKGYFKDVTARDQIENLTPILNGAIKTINLSNNQQATVYSNMTNYYAMICVAYIPGDGGMVFALRNHNGTSSIINLLTGSPYSSNYIDFEFNSNSVTVKAKNYSGYRLTFITLPPYTL